MVEDCTGLETLVRRKKLEPWSVDRLKYRLTLDPGGWERLGPVNVTFMLSLESTNTLSRVSLVLISHPCEAGIGVIGENVWPPSKVRTKDAPQFPSQNI